MRITGIFILFILLCSYGAEAQYKRPDNVRVRLGNLDTTAATYEQIVADPQIRAADSGDCVILGYKIAASAPDKGYYGPYNVTGARLTADVIQRLREWKNLKFRIYIEDIHVKYGGKVYISNPVSVKCIQ